LIDGVSQSIESSKEQWEINFAKSFNRKKETQTRKVMSTMNALRINVMLFTLLLSHTPTSTNYWHDH